VTHAHFAITAVRISSSGINYEISGFWMHIDSASSHVNDDVAMTQLTVGVLRHMTFLATSASRVRARALHHQITYYVRY